MKPLKERKVREKVAAMVQIYAVALARQLLKRALDSLAAVPLSTDELTGHVESLITFNNLTVR